MPYETTLPPKPHRGRLRPEEEEAYVGSLTDEQRDFYEQRKERQQEYREATQTSVGSRRSSSRRRSVDDDISPTELTGILRYLFEAASMVLRSDAQWSDDEFNQIARGLLVLINRISQLKIVVRMLTPITSAVQLLGKVRKLLDARQQRRQSKQQNNQAA